MRIILLLVVTFFLQFTAALHAQNVAINTTGAAPESCAILDLQSVTNGLLIPRMTQVQRELISAPVTGLMIYQTDGAKGLYSYTGTGWFQHTSSSNVWSTNGNSGMDPNTDFIGTNDNIPLRLRLNNQWAGELNHITGNITLGDSTGISITNGNFNSGLGHKSLSYSTSGYHNVAVGAFSLYKNTSGYYNAALGGSSLFANTQGHHNVAVGFQTLYENIGGDDNTVLGAVAMYYNLEGDRNTAIGRAALQNGLSSDNTAIGYRTMYHTTLGVANTAVGIQALEFNTSGNQNVAIGFNSLKDANASNNVGVGFEASRYNTTGSNNVAVGWLSLWANMTGSSNTGVGKGACFGCSGSGNTAIGAEALSYGPTGSLNTAIGNLSGAAQNIDNTIGINNWNNHVEFDNYVHIGNLSNVWNGGNVPWSTFSDARVKTDIREDVKGLDFILRLRPVTYHRDIDAQEELHGWAQQFNFPHRYDIEEIKFSGFLAQEVETAALESDYDFSGITLPKSEHAVYTLSYETFVVPLVKAVQEQQTVIELQVKKIELLEARLKILEEKLMRL